MLHATGTPQSFFSVPANGPKLLDQFRDASLAEFDGDGARDPVSGGARRERDNDADGLLRRLSERRTGQQQDRQQEHAQHVRPPTLLFRN